MGNSALTETSKPRADVRLIDANALVEKIRKHYKGGVSIEDIGLDIAIHEINSAPTVETTACIASGSDARLFDKLPERAYIWKRNNEEYWAGEMYENSDGDVSIDFPKIGNTPLEAVKKLESSINRK